MTFTTKQINNLLGIEDCLKAPEVLMKAMLNPKKREHLFNDFLKIEKDLSYDWFQDYYEEEQSQRKTFKQEFTPTSIAKLISQIVSDGKDASSFLDPSAGNGGMLIQSWIENTTPLINPSHYWFVAQEISERSIPFLIFNFAIRGWNGLIYHGDTLERKFKNVFFIQNSKDDWFKHSEVNVVPRTISLQDKEWLEIDCFYGEEIKHIESKNINSLDNKKIETAS